MSETDVKPPETGNEIAGASPGKLSLRLGEMEVVIGGATFRLRAVSAGVAEHARRKHTLAISVLYECLRYSLYDLEGVYRADENTALPLRFEDVDISGVISRRLNDACWRELTFGLAAWVIDELAKAVETQSFTVPAEKKN